MTWVNLMLLFEQENPHSNKDFRQDRLKYESKYPFAELIDYRLGSILIYTL